jgi:hypothetical protein
MTDAGGWDVCEVPTIVRVRAGTVAQLPELFDWVPAVEYPVDLTLAEATAAAARHGLVSGQGHLSLSPAQLARGLGAPRVARAALGCVAVVEVDPGGGGFHVRRMSAPEAAEQLPRIRFGRDSYPTSETVFRRYAPAAPPPAPGEATPPRLTEAVPWFHVRAGARFLRSRQAPRELLQTLLEGR